MNEASQHHNNSPCVIHHQLIITYSSHNFDTDSVLVAKLKVVVYDLHGRRSIVIKRSSTTISHQVSHSVNFLAFLTSKIIHHYDGRRSK